MPKRGPRNQKLRKRLAKGGKSKPKVAKGETKEVKSEAKSGNGEPEGAQGEQKGKPNGGKMLIKLHPKTGLGARVGFKMSRSGRSRILPELSGTILL